MQPTPHTSMASVNGRPRQISGALEDVDKGERCISIEMIKSALTDPKQSKRVTLDILALCLTIFLTCYWLFRNYQ